VQFLADKDWLYIGARLDDPTGRVQVKPADPEAEPSRLVVQGEHVRVILSDGKQTRTFALSPEQRRYSVGAPGTNATPVWRATAAPQPGGWSVEMALPRSLFARNASVRINVVHRRQEGKADIDYELCPTYGVEGDPDLLMDWKPRDAVERFARLTLP
jgi:hypothetical protein